MKPFRRRYQPSNASTITTFCHYVHFFASPAAAADWIAVHPGTFVVSVTDGQQIGHAVNRARFATLPPT